MSSSHPLVSCIMPTYNRRHFVGQAIWYFLRQDYPAKELIIVDDGEDAIADLVPQDERIHYIRVSQRLTLGAKRNLACDQSQGEWIAHWDDDDWIAADRLSFQMTQVLANDVDLCGAQNLLYYRLYEGEAWEYRYPAHQRAWAAGGTLLYRRAIWQQHPFPAVNVGEDNAFIRQFPPERLLALPHLPGYIALMHGANTGAKNLADPRWQRCSLNEVTAQLGSDREFYGALRHGRSVPSSGLKLTSPNLKPSSQAASGTSETTAATQPLVTCLMPTYNRRAFVPQAIAYFQRQTYPHRELLIIDDGTEAIADLIPPDPRIRYLHLPQRHSIGAKRNLGCEAAQGEIVIFWDDDDWYAPHRIAYQVEPLLSGRSGVTALGNSPMFCLKQHQFWACTPLLYDRMFVGGVHGGTLAFWQHYWQQGARFPNSSLAEDVAFQELLIRSGVRLEKLANKDVFFYVRHAHNAWQFQTGEFLGRQGWQAIQPPDFISEIDLVFYGMSKYSFPSTQSPGLSHTHEQLQAY